MGDRAVFAGGCGTSGGVYYTAVDAFNGTTKVSGVSALSTARSELAGTAVGGFAVFAGGYTGSASAAADIYDASLTKQSLNLPLSTARRGLAAAAVGAYALFGGGYGSSVSGVVDVYTA